MERERKGIGISGTPSDRDGSSPLDAVREDAFRPFDKYGLVQLTPMDDYEYTLRGNGIMLGAYTGSEKRVSVPGWHCGLEVVALNRTFYYKPITSVVIPGSVKEIGDKTFFICEELESVTFAEDGLVKIGDSAFFMCFRLKHISLPHSVTSIGDKAFYGCGKLKRITIPPSATSSGEDAFKGDSKDRFNPIGFATYSRQYSPPTIYCANNSAAHIYVKENGYKKYKVLKPGPARSKGPKGRDRQPGPPHAPACGDAEGRSSGEAVKQSQEDGCSRNPMDSFSYMVNGDEISILKFLGQEEEVVVPAQWFNPPRTITSIGPEAFQEAHITSVSIPQGVSTIGKRAFYHCRDLERAVISCRNVVCEDEAFMDCESLVQVSVEHPEGIQLARDVFLGCNKLAGLEALGLSFSDYRQERAVISYTAPYNKGLVQNTEEMTAECIIGAVNYGYSHEYEQIAQEQTSGMSKRSVKDNLCSITECDNRVTTFQCARCGIKKVVFEEILGHEMLD
jgi:hypothetical protein